MHFVSFLLVVVRFRIKQLYIPLTVDKTLLEFTQNEILYADNKLKKKKLRGYGVG